LPAFAVVARGQSEEQGLLKVLAQPTSRLAVGVAVEKPAGLRNIQPTLLLLLPALWSQQPRSTAARNSHCRSTRVGRCPRAREIEPHTSSWVESADANRAARV